MKEFADILKNMDEKKLPAALCIIISVSGSVPRREGAKMLVRNDGSIFGTIGGGALEEQVIQDALKVIENKKPQTFKHNLMLQYKMCCGGTVYIYIEPIMKKNKLYIFGAGHVGKALVNQLSGFDFDMYVMDDRKEMLDEINIPDSNKLNHSFEEALNLLEFDNQTYIAIMTYSHQTDRDILFYCLEQPHSYLGMIGSKRKVEITKKLLKESELINQELLKNTDMPMGLEIGAEGPEEIALSIAARLIQVKNNRNKVH